MTRADNMLERVVYMENLSGLSYVKYNLFVQNPCKKFLKLEFSYKNHIQNAIIFFKNRLNSYYGIVGDDGSEKHIKFKITAPSKLQIVQFMQIHIPCSSGSHGQIVQQHNFVFSGTGLIELLKNS